MNRLLRAKHWQLFLLIVGIPIVFQIFFMTVFVGTIMRHQIEGGASNEPNVLMPIFFVGIAAVILLSVGTLMGWMYSIAIGLQSKVPEGVELNVKRFKTFYWTPVIYIGLIILFSVSTINGYAPHPGVIALIVPLHLFSIFCMFYILNFVAKTLKTVELQRAVTFSDFVGEFFLIWFYFIGIWILQPKINRFHRGEIEALGYDRDEVI
ncbi:MAG: hypothetical protein ACFHU9_09785 [Fluviicola sp.]